MTRKYFEDNGPNLYSEALFDREEMARKKQALIDNIKLANNAPYKFTETTLERLMVDHMRTRCDRCYTLTSVNKHSALFVVGTEKLCWCCWFDEAFYGQHGWKPFNGERYYNTPTRARRRKACADKIP